MGLLFPDVFLFLCPFSSIQRESTTNPLPRSFHPRVWLDTPICSTSSWGRATPLPTSSMRLTSRLRIRHCRFLNKLPRVTQQRLNISNVNQPRATLIRLSNKTQRCSPCMFSSPCRAPENRLAHLHSRYQTVTQLALWLPLPSVSPACHQASHRRAAPHRPFTTNSSHFNHSSSSTCSTYSKPASSKRSRGMFHLKVHMANKACMPFNNNSNNNNNSTSVISSLAFSLNRLHFNRKLQQHCIRRRLFSTRAFTPPNRFQPRPLSSTPRQPPPCHKPPRVTQPQASPTPALRPNMRRRTSWHRDRPSCLALNRPLFSKEHPRTYRPLPSIPRRQSANNR